MIAAFANFWDWSVTRSDEIERPAPKPYRAPMFIGDVALPRGGTTEFYHQWKQATATDDEGQP